MDMVYTSAQPVLNPQKLPEGFIYLNDIDSTILEDVRYATHHNLIGRPVPGYEDPRVIMTLQAAQALHALQCEILPFQLSLKVYDAYRPQRAVNEFIRWSEDPKDDIMRTACYPTVPKDELFDRGYFAKRSGHTRGSTVDLTLVPLPAAEFSLWKPGDPVLDERLPVGQRFPDNSLDMGTGFDCLDELSHPLNPNLPDQVRANRFLLSTLMKKHGFRGITTEWWHFTLNDEPFPDTYFDFPIR